MGQLKLQLGDYREAEDLFQEAISITRHNGGRWGLAIALRGLGECFQQTSKPNEAVPLLEEAYRLWNELSQLLSAQRAASTLVELKRSQGKWDGALVWYDHVIAAYRSLKQHLDVTNHLIAKGMLLMELQRQAEAALHFEAAIATCRENGIYWPEEREKLCAISKMAMTWERRLPLLCDLKKLQRRLPQLVTASLKLPIPSTHGEP